MRRFAAPVRALLMTRTQRRLTAASDVTNAVGAAVLGVLGVLMILVDPVALSGANYQRVVFLANPDAQGLLLLLVGTRLALPHTTNALLSYSRDAAAILAGVYIALCGSLLGTNSIQLGQAGFSYTLVPVGLSLLFVTLGELLDW